MDGLSIAEMFDVQGRVAVVTGASSGLGERFARVLAANGATVVAAARRLDRLEALAGEYADVVAVRADLAEETERAALMEEVLQRFGRVDILVNNAGYGTPQPAVDEPIDDFRAVLELNLVALFELSRLAARSMIAQRGGTIINIASILGLVSSTPIPNASYSASKGAVVNLTRELGCQWARHGVRVNAIAPGFFPTESTAGMEPGTPGGDFAIGGCPMRRLGQVDELDGALMFLASGASSFCTGQVITVDGGWTAR